MCQVYLFTLVGSNLKNGEQFWMRRNYAMHGWQMTPGTWYILTFLVEPFPVLGCKETFLTQAHFHPTMLIPMIYV